MSKRLYLFLLLKANTEYSIPLINAHYTCDMDYTNLQMFIIKVRLIIGSIAVF